MIAVKKIDKKSLRNQKIQETLIREVKIHSRIVHQNIVRLYTAFEVQKKDSQHLYLFLEYAEKGNLFNIIRQMRQMTEA